MLYVHEKVAKLGGVYLGGQVSSVEIQEAATIYVAQDDKGSVKKTQPVGYENAKVMIDIILEDSPEESAIEQLTKIERLFKTPEQTSAKLFAIVNEECAARGISQVYFKSFTSKKVISESKMIASLELWEPKTASIAVVKKTGSGRSTKNNTNSAAVKEADNAEDTENNTGKEKGRNTSNTRNVASGNNSSKSKGKSPATDTRDTTGGKKTAKNIVNRR